VIKLELGHTNCFHYVSDIGYSSLFVTTSIIKLVLFKVRYFHYGRLTLT